MSPVPAGDAATVSVLVRISVDDAFDVFTREIDQWWRQGPQYRIGGRRRGRIFFEPGLGGRLFETFELSSGSRTIAVGVVTLWEPPFRLGLEWRGVNFQPNEKTFVDVTFAVAEGGTLVTVRHHGWSALPPQHPVRHGQVGAAFSRRIGLFWGGLLSGLREHVQSRLEREDGDKAARA